MSYEDKLKVRIGAVGFTLLKLKIEKKKFKKILSCLVASYMGTFILVLKTGSKSQSKPLLSVISTHYIIRFRLCGAVTQNRQ